MRLSKNKTEILFISAIFISIIVFLTICSTNSFLYEMNVWGDVNCYYTVAKSMMGGKVLYRDIYEQKGLYLYLVHILAIMIDSKGYLGMYAIEMIYGFIFAFSMYKILSLFIDDVKRKSVYTILIMLLFYIAPTFCQGDSAEEMTLPLFAISSYFIIKSLKNKTIMPWWQVMLSGMFAGIAIFIKFTLVSFYIPFCLSIFFVAIKDKKTANAFLYVLYFILGLGIGIAPALAYFGANDAFDALWEGYFYNNLFLYSTAESKSVLVMLNEFIWAYISSFAMSYPIYPFIIIGLIYLFKNKEHKHRLGIYILVSYILMNFFIFAGGRKYSYYSMPMNLFTWYGLLMVDRNLLPKFKESIEVIKKPLLTFVLSTFVLCFFLNGNTYQMFRAKEDYYQFKFKDIILEEENPTLLNYGFLDMGLYYLCDIEPNNKYFATLNIDLEDMHESQKNGILNGDFTFVVTRNKPLSVEFDKYELVSYERGEYGKGMHDFYLYKLIA